MKITIKIRNDQMRLKSKRITNIRFRMTYVGYISEYSKLIFDVFPEQCQQIRCWTVNECLAALWDVGSFWRVLHNNFAEWHIRNHPRMKSALVINVNTCIVNFKTTVLQKLRAKLIAYPDTCSTNENFCMIIFDWDGQNPFC